MRRPMVRSTCFLLGLSMAAALASGAEQPAPSSGSHIVATVSGSPDQLVVFNHALQESVRKLSAAADAYVCTETFTQGPSGSGKGPYEYGTCNDLAFDTVRKDLTELEYVFSNSFEESLQELTDAFESMHVASAGGGSSGGMEQKTSEGGNQPPAATGLDGLTLTIGTVPIASASCTPACPYNKYCTMYPLPRCAKIVNTKCSKCVP